MDYRVIKEGDLFLLSDLSGDVTENNERGHGLYTKDTRFLSRMEIRVDGEKPTLLSSETDKSYLASFRLIKEKKDEGAIEVYRERFIYQGVLYERVSLTNHFPQPLDFAFAAGFDADFQDMFLVRKYRTGEIGEIVERSREDAALSIRYRGADDVVRETRIEWDTEEALVEEDTASVHFALSLQPKETQQICFFITPLIGEESVVRFDFEEGLERLEATYEQWYGDSTGMTSDSEVFNSLYRRSIQDLRMLMTNVGYGDMPVAGLPWFAVPFGRDSLITSLFMLPLNPLHAEGTLRTLAAYQGKAEDPWRDEQPGKIMHEIRYGELVTTGQSPFGPYYGSVDATPLFLVLIGEYCRWTGNLSLARELRPNIERALAWIDRAAEEGGGFLTYHQEAEKGFPNQGWKDSSNSIVTDAGEYARSPIALSEVQGYVYQAKKGLVPIFKELGDAALADRLEREAEELKARFEEAFWMEDEQFYAIALDREKRQVRSVTSNPGHLLASELPDAVRAGKIARRMLAEDMFNGYGVRTMSTDSTGYYPMSYHNGSVWPHDNGMILLGLSRLGFKQETGKLISGLLEASRFLEYRRLPELFCGHGSELGRPVPYPTTCSPQAWAAATSIAFMQATLGLFPDAIKKEIVIQPCLPDCFNELKAQNMRIGAGTLSVKITRDPDAANGVAIDILENTTGFVITLN